MTIKTVTVLGNEFVIRKEAIALGTITPGMLLERGTGGVVAHNSAAENAQRVFAVEREITGDGIDVNYLVNETCLFGFFPPGSVVYAIAGAAGVTVNGFVESAGDGKLVDVQADAATDTAQRAAVVGVALDTASTGNRFRLEVL